MDWIPLRIEYYGNDAEGFKEIVDHLVFKLLELYNPDEVAVIRIKNWFDHKWLNYSGKKIIKYDDNSHPHIPFILTPFWNTEITIPPFNPNRILSEIYYKPDGNHSEKFTEVYHKWQNSSDNLKNKIVNRTNNGLCLWISSNSVQNRQGCIMAYRIHDGNVDSWYANIEENGLWRLSQTKGISKNKLLVLLTELNDRFKSN